MSPSTKCKTVLLHLWQISPNRQNLHDGNFFADEDDGHDYPIGNSSIENAVNGNVSPLLRSLEACYDLKYAKEITFAVALELPSFVFRNGVTIPFLKRAALRKLYPMLSPATRNQYFYPRFFSLNAGNLKTKRMPQCLNNLMNELNLPQSKSFEAISFTMLKIYSTTKQSLRDSPGKFHHCAFIYS